jgi:uncharacterized membrane protein YccC
MAIRACVAVVIAYAIALHLDWDKPYWAAWTAFSIGLATRGEGIHTGLMRLAGGLVGALGGFVLLAFFIQDRWLFIAFLSLYGAIFTYLALGSTHRGYFWQQAGFFATVIAFDSAFNPGNAFEVAIERAQETGTGLVTYVVVALLLWPESSRRKLDQTTSKLIGKARQLLGECRGLVAGEQGVREMVELRDEIHRLQAQVDKLLGAAESDSWEVAEVRLAWRSFREQLDRLNETLIRWRSDLDESQAETLRRLARDLPSYLGEIDQRLAEIADMTAGNPPKCLPEPIAVELDDDLLKSLPHFDSAAVTAQRDRLAQLDALTRALFQSMCLIRGFNRSGAEVNDSPARPDVRLPVGRFSLDRDHLDEAVRTAASIWLMFLAIVYIPDVPAGLGALGIATRLAFADSELPSFSLTRLFVPVTLAMVCAFPFYIFLMPQLSSFPELALMVSVVVFAVVYIFHEPKQALLRTIFAYLFFTLIDVTNEQTYSFMHFATTSMMWLVILTVLTVTEYLPVSHQPDRVFLRLLNRFFRSCEFLLQLGRTPRHEYSLAQRMKARFHTYEVMTLPAKLSQWGRALPPAALGTSPAGEVQALVNRLWGLSYRMEALLEARALHQSTALVRELRPDIRAWRTGVENILRSLAVEPASADHRELRSRLLAMTTRLEARIEEALDATSRESISAEESENMYRLLSAHRGVSESLVQLTKPTAAIDWDRLREARF